MMFEYNLEKSKSNKIKHGIDFEEAQVLWEDAFLLKVLSKYQIEKRFLFIGKIQDKHWSAITTYREKTIRFISVRRARKQEIEFYEAHRFR